MKFEKQVVDWYLEFEIESGLKNFWKQLANA